MAEDPLCPICCEKLDATDQNFYPCQCNYQICLWCYQRISEGPSPLCPHCRTPYDKKKVTEVPSKKIIEQARDEQRRKRIEERREQRQEKEKRPPPTISGPPPALAEQLAHVKVRQRNLVYVTGIPVPDCREEILRRPNWFGRFGRIISCVTKNDSAYITYQKAQDAESAIAGMHGRPTSDGRALRCAVGTTKYCSFFLRRQECPNPTCLYLHEIARTEDTVIPEDVVPNRNTKSSLFESSLQPQSSLFESSLQPQSSLFESSLQPQSSLFESSLQPMLRHKSLPSSTSSLSQNNQPVVAAKPPRLRAPPPGFSSQAISENTNFQSLFSRNISSMKGIIGKESIVETTSTTDLNHIKDNSVPSKVEIENFKKVLHEDSVKLNDSTKLADNDIPVLQRELETQNLNKPLATNTAAFTTTTISPINHIVAASNVATTSSSSHKKSVEQTLNETTDFKAIWQSLMAKDNPQIHIANLAALSYTSSNILENLQPRTSSRFNFVSHPEKNTYDFNTNESVIQKLLSGSASLNSGNSTSLYGSSSFF